jgi:2-phospho-L-lactate transferase/gluconeogenesis factor (CofD/UPF0052 family)
VPSSSPRRSRLRVVLFSGGRGSGALTTQLVSNPRIALTIAINGYDDGASTGEVRRFLGDSLGPSDFRKNASRLARLLNTAPLPLIDLLDLRLRDTPASAAMGPDLAGAIEDPGPERTGLAAVRALAAFLSPPARADVAARVRRFAGELELRGAPFSFADCSVGNLVFAGGFLANRRSFNAAVDDYCTLVGLPAGLIENVTDGTNAFLVAIDADGRLLGSEEEIVDAKRRNRINDIYLLERRLDDAHRGELAAMPRDERARRLEGLSAVVRLNPRLAAAIEEADLIIYAPGTQHSSLFPSYLTPGLSDRVAANLAAIKLLVTNIQADAEITGSSAVDIIDRAVFYLKEKGRRRIATPCLITHYLLNDPQRPENEASYVPLGRVDSLEDPRLIRVANYEEGLTGRHDATKILGPFIDAFVSRRDTTQKVAVVLYESGTVNKVVQSILEMTRAGVRDLHADVTVFHDGPGDLEPDFVERTGFPARRLSGDDTRRDRELREALAHDQFDYVVLFESSGMYNGEDIAALITQLSAGRLDAVWGSRRLSVNDIHASYRLTYHHRALLGAVSYAGSHLLSLMYLALYGRYVSDTLSGARGVRVRDLLLLPVPVTDKLANQHLLSLLLRRKAEMFELPVQFFPISPRQVRRTRPADGLLAAATILRGRFSRLRPPASVETPAPDVAGEASRQAPVR